MCHFCSHFNPDEGHRCVVEILIFKTKISWLSSCNKSITFKYDIQSNPRPPRQTQTYLKKCFHGLYQKTFFEILFENLGLRQKSAYNVHNRTILNVHIVFTCSCFNDQCASRIGLPDPSPDEHVYMHYEVIFNYVPTEEYWLYDGFKATISSTNKEVGVGL